jgi:hypothetical protein
MTKKSNKLEGANLTIQQKEVLKKQILQEFPNLAIFNEDIDFLIEEYSKDKLYASKLMKTKNPLESIIDENSVEKIRIIKADTDEWKDIIEKMEKSKEEFVNVNVGDEEKSTIIV